MPHNIAAIPRVNMFSFPNSCHSHIAEIFVCWNFGFRWFANGFTTMDIRYQRSVQMLAFPNHQTFFFFFNRASNEHLVNVLWIASSGPAFAMKKISLHQKSYQQKTEPKLTSINRSIKNASLITGSSMRRASPLPRLRRWSPSRSRCSPSRYVSHPWSQPVCCRRCLPFFLLISTLFFLRPQQAYRGQIHLHKGQHPAKVIDKNTCSI